MAARRQILSLFFNHDRLQRFFRGNISTGSAKCLVRFISHHSLRMGANCPESGRPKVSTGILKSEFPSVPVQSEPFSKTFLDTIWRHASNDPHRPALINASDESDYVTFGQLFVHCHSVAAFLERRAFGHRHIACVVMANCWEYMAIFGGVILRGGTLSLASYVYTSFELQRQFEDSKCTTVFCAENCLEKTLEAAKAIPAIKTIIVVPDARVPRPPLPPNNENSEIFHFDEVLRTHPIAEQPTAEDFRVDNEIIILPYSRETQLDFLPFYHIYGIAVIVNHLLNGSTVVVMRGFDANLLCQHLEKHKCQFLLLVPPIMIFLAKSPVVDRYDLSHLKLVMSGAAPAGHELCEELQKRLPQLMSIAQGYGMTELSIASHIPALDDKIRYEKSGKLMPNMELKILDVKSGEVITDSEEPGELYLRGPNVMMGYFGRPDATAETLDEDNWLRTGDIAYVDKDGYLCVVDRLKELIKVRGLQVAPAEMEDILLSMPEVKDCAVVGVADASAGELPKAFVVRADDSLTAEQVQEYVKERVAYYKQLKGGVEFVEEIPKSPSGKILRRILREKCGNA